MKREVKALEDNQTRRKKVTQKSLLTKTTTDRLSKSVKVDLPTRTFGLL